MVTNMIPYDYCTAMLKESLKIFDENDDIYVGIKAVIEKLNHYYDKVSPMVGIALILNPTMKNDFLKKSLGWQSSGWIALWINFLHYSVSTMRSQKHPHQPQLLLALVLHQLKI